MGGTTVVAHATARRERKKEKTGVPTPGVVRPPAPHRHYPHRQETGPDERRGFNNGVTPEKQVNGVGIGAEVPDAPVLRGCLLPRAYRPPPRPRGCGATATTAVAGRP